MSFSLKKMRRFPHDHISTCPHARIVPWLHIDLQRLMRHSFALTRAFSEQMSQVANTGGPPMQSAFQSGEREAKFHRHFSDHFERSAFHHVTMAHEEHTGWCCYLDAYSVRSGSTTSSARRCTMPTG